MKLSWTQSSQTTWYCNHGKYFLKKKIIAGREQYEIWKGELLKFTTEQYVEFRRKIRENIFYE